VLRVIGPLPGQSSTFAPAPSSFLAAAAEPRSFWETFMTITPASDRLASSPLSVTPDGVKPRSIPTNPYWPAESARLQQPSSPASPEPIVYVRVAQNGNQGVPYVANLMSQLSADQQQAVLDAQRADGANFPTEPRKVIERLATVLAEQAGREWVKQHGDKAKIYDDATLKDLIREAITADRSPASQKDTEREVDTIFAAIRGKPVKVLAGVKINSAGDVIKWPLFLSDKGEKTPDGETRWTVWDRFPRKYESPSDAAQNSPHFRPGYQVIAYPADPQP
jgi:hypothetical protein